MALEGEHVGFNNYLSYSDMMVSNLNLHSSDYLRMHLKITQSSPTRRIRLLPAPTFKLFWS